MKHIKTVIDVGRLAPLAKYVVEKKADDALSDELVWCYVVRRFMDFVASRKPVKSFAVTIDEVQVWGLGRKATGAEIGRIGDVLEGHGMWRRGGVFGFDGEEEGNGT